MIQDLLFEEQDQDSVSESVDVAKLEKCTLSLV